MKIYTFGLATVAAILMSQFSAPLPNNQTATNSYTVNQATFTLNQRGSMLNFEIRDNDPLAIDKIYVDGNDLGTDQSGNYTFDMGQQLQTEVVLSSDTKNGSDASDPMRHLASRSFSVQNIGLSNIAIAQSTSATRTRIRYQTFIESPEVSAPLLCVGNYVNVPGVTHFNGNNRSWDANSNSYKTRFDTIISWGSNSAVASEVSVGPTIAYIGVPPFLAPISTETASSESMKLTVLSLSPTYVTYRINQKVVNPFCAGADGIRFGFNFYVRSDGVYTMAGNYLPVPFHEVYARDNLDISWRQMFREGSENFSCFLPVYSSTCDINTSQRAAF